MAPPYWPLFDLRLTTPDLVLRPMTEADQATVARVLPDDVELDPAATTYPGLDERATRAVVVHQAYWHAYGSWRPEAWRLNFAVLAGGELIGAQELEGNDFPTLRTVDTSSFLVTSARGRGLGKQMRAAVLALAFGPLAAQAAITEAWHDNRASLGVSRSLGYLHNGESMHRRGTDVDVMVHLRLTREAWLARNDRPDVTISGFDRCRPLFGLPPG
jgi:RimJ/RimL family protein N-acetyltransferase